MVRVFDSVFSPAACALLHTAACSRGLGHALFPREQPESAIETALASFLDEIGDSSQHVEYWSRQEWKHIEAHADVDEKLAASSDEPFRYPHTGHVLYLDVGCRVRGPTCVWDPDAASGSEFGALTAVPAVAGRVLRFDGHLQHAVPRPADVWLAPFTISQSGPAEEFMRSVVLFNTWSEPPMDVEREAAPEGESTPSLARCTPRDHWSEVTVRHAPAPAADASPTNMKLWLLGDEKRRGRPERTLALPVDGPAVSSALEELHDVTRLGAPHSPDADAADAAAAGKAPAAQPPAAPPVSRAMALAAALRKAAEEAEK